jgi:hypothetical protein
MSRCPHSQIVQFYSKRGVDSAGRSLDAVLGMSDRDLEHVHDYVQWLFPMRVPSPVNPAAPIVNSDIQREFLERPDLRKNLCQSCARMLRFYGLECANWSPPSGGVRPAVSFLQKCDNWLISSNHNHLRLTRIMTSLRLLGLGLCSRELFRCVDQIAADNKGRVTAETRTYWIGSQRKHSSPNKVPKDTARKFADPQH